MRNLLEEPSAAQCLDEEPSNGETAYPVQRMLVDFPFGHKLAGCDDGFMQAARLG